MLVRFCLRRHRVVLLCACLAQTGVGNAGADGTRHPATGTAAVRRLPVIIRIYEARFEVGHASRKRHLGCLPANVVGRSNTSVTRLKHTKTSALRFVPSNQRARARRAHR